MPVFLDESEGLSLIRLEGEVGIAHAAELMSLLLEALALGILWGLLMRKVSSTERGISVCPRGPWRQRCCRELSRKA